MNYKNNFELILINDCSTDVSDNDLQEIVKSMNLKYFKHEVNKGYAFATKSALMQSSGDHIFILDGDGEYPVNNIVKFNLNQTNVPALILPLRLETYPDFKRRLGSSILAKLCRLFLSYPKSDINGGIKYINGKYKEFFLIEEYLNLVNPELWSIAFKNDLYVDFVEVDRVFNTEKAKSKVFTNLVRLFFKILLYIWRLNRKIYNK